MKDVYIKLFIAALFIIAKTVRRRCVCDTNNSVRVSSGELGRHDND